MFVFCYTVNFADNSYSLSHFAVQEKWFQQRTLETERELRHVGTEVITSQNRNNRSKNFTYSNVRALTNRNCFPLGIVRNKQLTFWNQSSCKPVHMSDSGGTLLSVSMELYFQTALYQVTTCELFPGCRLPVLLETADK